MIWPKYVHTIKVFKHPNPIGSMKTPNKTNFILWTEKIKTILKKPPDKCVKLMEKKSEI